MPSSRQHDSHGHQPSYMPLKGFSCWACADIGQMFSPSRMFSWHQSFSISAPWKKGKRSPLADSRVVLTNMKILSNEKNQREELRQDPPTTSDSPAEPGPPESSAVPEHPASSAIICDTSVKTECLTTLPGHNTLTPKHQVLRLAKFESEDSGVELPSGANSPSTPKGSEKSFVLHSRDPSCDSGVLSASSSPAADHAGARVCKDTVDACLCISEGKQPAGLCAGQSSAVCLEDGIDGPEGGNPEQSFLGGSQGERLEEKPSASILPTKLPEEKRPSDDYRKGNLEDRLLPGPPLRKYPTSDSLDEYMDECCRLSKVNQGNAKLHGSGLGYLEHICQLIEKIGQLQEHNLRLQKQVSSLQKEQKANQLTEEYVRQHCSCGAASILLRSYQEGKIFFPGKSRPQSLLGQNGNKSDLSIIPEGGGGGSNDKASKGRDVHLDLEKNQLIMEIQLSNGKRSGEKECREGYSVTDGQAYLLKESAMKRGFDISRSTSADNPAWGRMKDLLRKSRGRNQSRLGLSSAALKRSCPQLYRPDSACLDLRKTERNSMIALGHSSRNESLWPF